MNRARLALTALALAVALGLVAAAWASPGSQSSGSRSGGARAYPVVPSSGGGSQPAEDSDAGSGAAPGAQATPTTPAVPAPQTGTTGTGPAAGEEGTEEILVPLEDEDRGRSGGAGADEVHPDGGGFAFLASTGEVGALVMAGASLVVSGLVLRTHWQVAHD